MLPLHRLRLAGERHNISLLFLIPYLIFINRNDAQKYKTPIGELTYYTALF